MSESGDKPRNRFRLPRGAKNPQRTDDSRRTERLTTNPVEGVPAQEPTNPNWRRRATGQPSSSQRRAPLGAFPTSPQEFQLWLQRGGWRYLAVLVALLIIALFGILLLTDPGTGNNVASTPLRGTPDPREQSLQGVAVQPTLTIARPSPTPAPTIFVVINTGEFGLFLRADHSTNSEVRETLPDGTRVQRIGTDFSAADRVWRNIRSPSGQEGWVAADFLQPTQ